MAETQPLLDETDSVGAPAPQRGLVNRVAPDGAAMESDDDVAKANTNSRRKVALVILLFAVALIGAVIALGVVLANQPSSTQLQDSVTTSNIFTHLDRFNVIANYSNLNSRSVLNNFNASADYVIDQLTQAGVCEPVTQPFVVPVHELLETPTLAMLTPYSIPYLNGIDFINMRYGGNGTFTNVVGNVYYAPNGGCSKEDYDNMPPNSIAAADEGTCDVVIKAFAAEASQNPPSALLQLNLATSTALRNTRVRIVDWQEGDPLVQIPVFSISWSVGSTIKQLVSSGQDVQLTFSLKTTLTLAYTYNIICSPNPGATANIVMLGAHLDSVPEGPGLDDNASGSSTVLELALQYHHLGFTASAVNPVRFAWWGAEEIGLLGARHYVREMQAQGKLNETALYLNFDMLGAPNYTPQIHKGDAVNSNIPEDVQKSSIVIQQYFEQYFQNAGLPNDYASMTGGSDYLPFLEAGIPSGGMATGASGLKTQDQRAIFGGFANAAYDPCYHISCDTVLNVSPEGLRQCAEAAAFVLQSFAFESDLNGVLHPALQTSTKDL